MSSTTRPLQKHETAAQKWRKPASRLMAVVGLAMILLTAPRHMDAAGYVALKSVGVILLSLAALGRIWSLAYIAGRKNARLCQSGPYSLTRNPLYLFSFLGMMGFTFVVQNLLVSGFAALCFLPYYAFVIRGEEKRLLQLHGADFSDYCQRVPRFWPRLATPTSEAMLELNLVPFLKGMREASCFLGAIVIAELIVWAHATALWPAYTLPF